MMTKLNKILVGALLVQLALAVIVLSRGSESSVIREEPVLAGFDASAVTRVQIFDGASADRVDLVKRGEGWVLASHFDYPAEASRVTDMLAPIAKMKAGEPIATSTSRHGQLKVGDSAYDRKLVITAGGADKVVFVGGSAGLRRTAIRLGGSEDVLGVTGVSTTALHTKARDWVASRYYEAPQSEITRVAIQRGAQTIELVRTVTPPAAAGSGSGAAAAGSGSGSGTVSTPPWKVVIDGTVVVPAAGEVIQTGAVEAIVSAVSALEASPADPKRDTSAPTVTITIDRKGGSDVLDVLAGDAEVWVKRRGLERATSLDKLRLKPVLEAARDKLVGKPAPAPAPAPGAGGGMPGMPGMPDLQDMPIVPEP